MFLGGFFSRTRRVPEDEAMNVALDAAVFDAMAEAHAFLDRSFVRKLISHAGTKGVALDVGCGSGRLARMISEAVPRLRVVGADLSDAMLDIARTASGSMRTGAPEWIKADATRLPIPNGCMDIVVSQHMLHHLADPAAAIREMQRVLKPGGALFVRDLRRPRIKGMVVLTVAVAGRIYDRLGPNAPHARRLYGDSLRAALSAREWRDLALRCGLGKRAAARAGVFYHQDIFWRKPSGA